jgi:dTDP-4-dehydrorhamnose reductase
LRQALRDASVAGTYHAVAGGQTSWCGYARHVLAVAQRAGVALKAGPDAVTPIPTSQYPTPAQRPLNSRLDTTRLRTTFGLQLPDWRVGVDRMLAEVLQRA